jgi:hypothetical protein
LNFDTSVKSRKNSTVVILAQARIQSFQYVLDPGLRRGDEFGAFYECINFGRGHRFGHMIGEGFTPSPCGRGLTPHPTEKMAETITMARFDGFHYIFP